MSSNEFESDRDLAARFAELRREDESQAPEFAAVMRRQVAASTRLRSRTLAIAAACLLVIAVLVARFRPYPPAAPVSSLTEWKSPTDFLLQTPGRDVLYSVPQFGSWPEDARAPAALPSPTGNKII